MVAFKKQIQTQWSFHICSTYGGCPITILFVSIKLHFLIQFGIVFKVYHKDKN